MNKENKNNPEKSDTGSEADRTLAEREQSVQEYLSFAVSKHRERKKLELNETVKAVTAGQPEAIQAKVLRTYDRRKTWSDKYQKYGVPEELLKEDMKKEVEIEARQTQANYIDKRIEMPNQELAKLETMRALSDILEKNPNVEDLKKIARVTFDLNGLKVVNDYSGTYASGDLYLQMMKKALENDEVRQWAKENKFNYTACREGGDEFSAVIVSEIPLTEDILNEFIRKVKDLLENDSEAEKCLNMDDDDTILRWKHKIPFEEGRKLKIAQMRAEGKEIKDDYKLAKDEETEAVLLGEKWKINALKQYREEIPAGFKFKGRVAAAAATIYDGLMDEDNKEKVAAGKDGNYEDALIMIVGCEFATGDRDMHKEKVSRKAGMAVSNDPSERFLAGLYNSTRSEEQDRELERERKKSEALEELNVLKNQMIDLKNSQVALYEAGGVINKEKIASIKLDISVKEQEIKTAEEKLKQSK